MLPERFFKYQIDTGEEYYQCVQALGIIKDEMTKFGIKDFIDLDIVLWHIYKDIIPREPKLAEPIEEEEKGTARLHRIIIDSHESTEFFLLELGKMLGYIPDVFLL
jgi:hypothetical protein